MLCVMCDYVRARCYCVVFDWVVLYCVIMKVFVVLCACVVFVCLCIVFVCL